MTFINNIDNVFEKKTRHGNSFCLAVRVVHELYTVDIVLEDK